MQPGTTIIKERTNKTFPPIVVVGADDRIVHVDFGTITLTLSAHNGGSTVVVRGRAENQEGNPIPLAMRSATDVKNTVEYYLTSET